MIILNEMMAHRLGDKAVINKDEDRRNKMELLYCKAVKYASKCDSYKHMFTPYYWAFRYFEKFKDTKKALAYAYLAISSAEQYCPDARPGYITKLLDCVKYIRNHDKKKWKDFYKKCRNGSKNKCVKKVFKKIK